MEPKIDNLALWNRHEKTDPAITKKVNQRGGFTAICAMHQMKDATKEWGPFGVSWGLKELLYSAIPGKYESEAIGGRWHGECVEVTLDAEFFYPGGQFPISTDMAYKPGNDTRKKLRTDCITKALSNLGFNADVFMGKFDDNKYVAKMAEHFNGEPKDPDQPDATAAFRAAVDELLARDVPVVKGEPSVYKSIGAQLGELFNVSTVEEAAAALDKVRLDGATNDTGTVIGVKVIAKETAA